MLLKHADPIQVQIDALIGLEAAFEPEFKMFWTRDNIVHQQLFYASKIWDGCVKCYLPTDVWFYFAFSVCFLWFLFYVIFRVKDMYHAIH